MPSGAAEPSLGYHPGCSELLTGGRDPALGQCQLHVPEGFMEQLKDKRLVFIKTLEPLVPKHKKAT